MLLFAKNRVKKVL